jgi:hypothetical protein
MKKTLIFFTIFATTISIAEYSVKIPLELTNGGSLPNGSIIIGDNNENGGGSIPNYDNCYDNPSLCFDDLIVDQGGNLDNNVNVCDFQRTASINGNPPYNTYWIDSLNTTIGTGFFWDSYEISANVNDGERFYNNPEGGIFYRGRFIENIANSYGGNYYEGQIYEICYYGPEWQVAPS